VDVDPLGERAAEIEKRPVPIPAEVREALAVAEREDPTLPCSCGCAPPPGFGLARCARASLVHLDLEAGELAVSGNVVHVSGL
jgi:hypothetical protein